MSRRVRVKNNREADRLIQILQLKCDFSGCFTGPTVSGHKITNGRGQSGLTFIFDKGTTNDQPRITAADVHDQRTNGVA